MDQDEQRVRARAYALWEEEGRPEGRHLDHWERAEAQPTRDAVDAAAGPSHGNEDFGGHDAEAEGSAEAGVGIDLGDADRPTQAPSDAPEQGEIPVRGAPPSPD